MTRRRLPIGIQTFRKLREQDCYYVDKTPYIERLLHEGTHYFLSRPRRFGKSLFLDTLKELFEGSQELFTGLYIHGRHEWSERHPVLRLSFGGGSFTEPAHLQASVMAQLEGAAEQAGVTARYATAPERFAHLLRTMHTHAGQRVAVLVDEYDKPILDALVDTPDVARANRDSLRGLYGVIKDSDAHVRFTFLTGISKFSKVNLFSQLNNLTDLTLDPVYSSICGYTEGDLGYEITVEESSSHGRLDMAVRAGGHVYLFEFKVVEMAPPGAALEQLQERDYAAKYRGRGEPIHLVGVEFSRQMRNVTAFDVADG